MAPWAGAGLDAADAMFGDRDARPDCAKEEIVAAIAVEGLRKSYGSTEAVKGISFEVRPGEIFALLGPNGAGKTTTVEILEGYRKRDSGTVSVLGVDPERGGVRLRERIGIVLQECGIEELLTPREVLDRQAGYYPNPRPVDDVIALVDLADKEGARIRTLSGGQRRRLDLALALVGDPDLIFLDEPTTGFDPQARRNAWDLVKRLCGLGKTVFLTTHYMEEAQFLADRVGVIAGGRLVALGKPDSIGGRDTADAQIRFTLPDGVGLDDLPLPATLDGARVLIQAADTTRTLHALTGWALERGVALGGLTVARRSLEDAYLDLVSEERPQAGPDAPTGDSGGAARPGGVRAGRLAMRSGGSEGR
jgi:ABC-2 type transport system ATP-binding protein